MVERTFCRIQHLHTALPSVLLPWCGPLARAVILSSRKPKSLRFIHPCIRFPVRWGVAKIRFRSHNGRWWRQPIIREQIILRKGLLPFFSASLGCREVSRILRIADMMCLSHKLGVIRTNRRGGGSRECAAPSACCSPRDRSRRTLHCLLALLLPFTSISLIERGLVFISLSDSMPLVLLGID